jgi:hypothetical protein
LKDITLDPTGEYLYGIGSIPYQTMDFGNGVTTATVSQQFIAKWRTSDGLALAVSLLNGVNHVNGITTDPSGNVRARTLACRRSS